MALYCGLIIVCVLNILLGPAWLSSIDIKTDNLSGLEQGGCVPIVHVTKRMFKNNSRPLTPRYRIFF